MRTEVEYELLDNWALNRMTKVQTEEFELKVQTDPNWVEEARLHLNIIEAIRVHRLALIKEQLQEHISNWRNLTIKKYRPPLKWAGFWWILIVPALIAAYFLQANYTEHEPSNTERFSSPVAPPNSSPNAPIQFIAKPDGVHNLPSLDIHVNDSLSFEVEKIGQKGEIYEYEIKADQKTWIVQSPDPELKSSLLKAHFDKSVSQKENR
jgi:hypothetical protein